MERKKKDDSTAIAGKRDPGAGIDIGTCYVVSSSSMDNKAVFKTQRDAFFDIENNQMTKGMLEKLKANYIESDDKRSLFVIGEEALQMANFFNREVRRPLSKGVISTRESEALSMIKIILRAVVGEPVVDNEVLHYSVPALPMDAEYNIVYHDNVLRSFLKSFGFNAIPMNEATAVGWAELGEESFTGLSLSFGAGMCNASLMFMGVSQEDHQFSVARCLDKDTLVCTTNGFIKIKDIIPNKHIVVDSYGKLCKVISKLNNGIRQDMYEVLSEGFCGPRIMTGDHKILVKKEINWEWEEVDKLAVGDIVGEPIVNCVNPIRQFYFGNKALGNKKYLRYMPMASRNLGRFIGAFLGDGYSTYNESTGQYHIKISFNVKEESLVSKYSDIIKLLFGLDARISSHGNNSNTTDIIVTDKVIAKKMKEFYDENKNKYLPIPLDSIPNNMALGILEGLLDTDGSYSCDRLSFSNTSSQLAFVFRQLLGRFGIKCVMKIRPPRQDGHLNKYGKPINGTKISYELDINTQYDIAKLMSMFRDYEGNIVKTDSYRFMESIVTEIKKSNESYVVYDLKIDSNQHSFSLPYMTVHNCGDWVDSNAATAIGVKASRITTIKEAGVDLKNPKGREQEAIRIYYENLITYVCNAIEKKVNSSDNLPNFPEPITVVVSGGTSKAGNFEILFEEELRKKKLPFQIKTIKKASDQLNAVAKGCLLNSLNHYTE